RSGDGRGTDRGHGRLGARRIDDLGEAGAVELIDPDDRDRVGAVDVVRDARGAVDAARVLPVRDVRPVDGGRAVGGSGQRALRVVQRAVGGGVDHVKGSVAAHGRVGADVGDGRAAAGGVHVAAAADDLNRRAPDVVGRALAIGDAAGVVDVDGVHAGRVLRLPGHALAGGVRAAARGVGRADLAVAEVAAVVPGGRAEVSDAVR